MLLSRRLAGITDLVAYAAGSDIHVNLYVCLDWGSVQVAFIMFSCSGGIVRTEPICMCGGMRRYPRLCEVATNV